MTLTNRKMLMAWFGLLALILALLAVGRAMGGHPLAGWHETVKSVAEDVRYVMAPVSKGSSVQKSEPHNGMVVLTVDASPASARVRVMNIGPAYQPGMELEPGSYDIEVSAPGYETQRRWVSISGRSAAPVFRLRKR